MRLLLLSAAVWVLMAPATVRAQEGHTTEPECFIQETGSADVPISFDEIDEIRSETDVPIVCNVEESVSGQPSGSGGGGGGVGAVARIDAGVGGAAASGSLTTVPWVLAAGAGVTGSVLRRRRR
jgi:hypothetical protein